MVLQPVAGLDRPNDASPMIPSQRILLPVSNSERPSLSPVQHLMGGLRIVLVTSISVNDSFLQGLVSFVPATSIFLPSLSYCSHPGYPGDRPSFQTCPDVTNAAPHCAPKERDRLHIATTELKVLFTPFHA
jgi:hypothetical protein